MNSASAHQAQSDVDLVEKQTPDYEVRPGDKIQIILEINFTDDTSIETIVIDNIPEGVSILNALENIDGSYTINGDAESFIVNTNNDFSGELNLTYTGYDAMHNAIEGTETNSSIDVSDSNTASNDAYISLQDDFAFEQMETQLNEEQTINFEPPTDTGAFDYDDNSNQDYDANYDL